MNRMMIGTILVGLFLATPLAAASVTVTAHAQPVNCYVGLLPKTVDTPFLNPYVSVTAQQDCSVDAYARYSTPFITNCPPVGPFPWLRPYVAVQSDCDVFVLA